MLEDVQNRLHDAGRQLPVSILNNHTRSLVFQMNVQKWQWLLNETRRRSKSITWRWLAITGQRAEQQDSFPDLQKARHKCGLRFAAQSNSKWFKMIDFAKRTFTNSSWNQNVLFAYSDRFGHTYIYVFVYCFGCFRIICGTVCVCVKINHLNRNASAFLWVIWSMQYLKRNENYFWGDPATPMQSDVDGQ